MRRPKKGARFDLEPKTAEAVWADHEAQMLAKHRVVGSPAPS